ncbi:hypothetical protein [Rhodococcus triatomae]
MKISEWRGERRQTGLRGDRLHRVYVLAGQPQQCYRFDTVARAGFSYRIVLFIAR